MKGVLGLFRCDANEGGWWRGGLELEEDEEEEEEEEEEDEE